MSLICVGFFFIFRQILFAATERSRLNYSSLIRFSWKLCDTRTGLVCQIVPFKNAPARTWKIFDSYNSSNFRDFLYTFFFAFILLQFNSILDKSFVCVSKSPSLLLDHTKKILKNQVSATLLSKLQHIIIRTIFEN